MLSDVVKPSFRKIGIIAAEIIWIIDFVKNNVVTFIQGVRADVENGEIMTFDQKDKCINM